MVFKSKKEKELEIFDRMVSLTNMRVLIDKGIVTQDEWNATSQEVLEQITAVAQTNGGFMDIAEAIKGDDGRE